MTELPMNDKNPCSFIRPFLVLVFREKYRTGSNIVWNVDVNGEIGKYLIGGDPNEGSHVNLLTNATDLLKEIVGQLADNGLNVAHVSTYTGTCGPDIILRNGALFRRTGLDEILSIKREGQE